MLNNGGVVLGMEKRRGKKEQLYYVGNDTHVLCVGATRSGKSRGVVLPTIGLTALAGESMVVADAKEELWCYTQPYLARLGYTTLQLNFRMPLQGCRINLLQQVIDRVCQGDIAGAIDAAWDITSILVGEPQGEPIWANGEAAVIAAAIMAVVCDNQDHPEYQNMANVYYFLANMCRGKGDKDAPINRYLADLPDTHPARAIMGIADIAPVRTKGSFYTAALTTLRLFSSPLIAEMTSGTDFDMAALGRDKVALFITVPDEKETYYTLATLVITQLYAALVRAADARGGRLERRVLMVMDEFGNFARFPIAIHLTVGGGRGIRYLLCVQSLAQLEKTYGQEVARIIEGNCETWLYLQADDLPTLETVSKMLGEYTVSVPSSSNSYSGTSSRMSSSSNSSNLAGRPLLTPAEVRLITRPYSLILSRAQPAMLRAPDLSAWYFNSMFGLGNEEHNRRVRQMRSARQPRRTAPSTIPLWRVWEQYQSPPLGDLPFHF